MEDESSDEAPGWYFGTVESITEDGNFLILYADNATEVILFLKLDCCELFNYIDYIQLYSL